MQPVQGWEYNVEKYREAITKEEQCKVPVKSDWGLYSSGIGHFPTNKNMSLEQMRKEYHEYCPKSKSNNIVFCPEKTIKRKQDKKVQWINDYFKNLEKKSKKKKTKKKSKGKRSKKKKTKGGNKKTKRRNKKTKRGKKKTKRKLKKTKTKVKKTKRKLKKTKRELKKTKRGKKKTKKGKK